MAARLDNVFFVLAAGAWIAIRPRRMRALLALDLFLIILGVLWSYLTRVGFGPRYAVLAESSYWMAALALAVRLPLYYLFGLYQAPSAFRLAGKPAWWGPAVYFARALLASAAGTLVLSGLMLGLFGSARLPRLPAPGAGLRGRICPGRIAAHPPGVRADFAPRPGQPGNHSLAALDHSRSAICRAAGGHACWST